MSGDFLDTDKMVKRMAKHQETFTPRQQVAILLHDSLCRHHVEGNIGCNWYYEMEHRQGENPVHLWHLLEHKRWLMKALKVQQFFHGLHVELDERLLKETDFIPLIHTLRA